MRRRQKREKRKNYPHAKISTLTVLSVNTKWLIETHKCIIITLLYLRNLHDAFIIHFCKFWSGKKAKIKSNDILKSLCVSDFVDKSIVRFRSSMSDFLTLVSLTFNSHYLQFMRNDFDRVFAKMKFKFQTRTLISIFDVIPSFYDKWR